MTYKVAMGLANVLGAILVGAALLFAKASWRRNALFGCDGGAWLGVSLSDVTPEKAHELKLAGEYGVIVTEVEKDSPSAKAGLARDDVILEFDGERVRSVAHLRRLVSETPPGRTVKLAINRAGQTRRLDVQLESGPEPFFRSEIVIPPIPEIKIPPFDVHVFHGGATFGISADELTPQLAAYFGVEQGKGVLVREVEAGSPAEKAGLKAGDCIVRANSAEVASVGDLRRALRRDSKAKRKVALSIVRNRQGQTITVELEPSSERWLLPPEKELETIDLESLGIDAQELYHLADDVRAQGRQSQEQALKARRELEKERHRWQQEWRRQWGEAQEQWQQELHRGLHGQEPEVLERAV